MNIYIRDLGAYHRWNEKDAFVKGDGRMGRGRVAFVDCPDREDGLVRLCYITWVEFSLTYIYT